MMVIEQTDHRRFPLLPLFRGRRWRTAPDEGQQQGRIICLRQVQHGQVLDLRHRPPSQPLPLTDRAALAAKRRLRGAVSSPPKQGERRVQPLSFLSIMEPTYGRD